MKKQLLNIWILVVRAYRAFIMPSFYKLWLSSYGKNVILRGPLNYISLRKVTLGDNTAIMPHFSMISAGGHFIMKRNSGTAKNLLVITGNHERILGEPVVKKGGTGRDIDEEDDIIVEEDVWIGANVTLCHGAHLSRGTTVGAGSVVRSKTPPYAIVIGNPAKIVGFNYTPDEIIEHEKKIYPESERISKLLLEKNYEKYFINRIEEIKQFTKL